MAVELAAGNLALGVIERGVQSGAQGGDRPDDDTGDQSYQQAVLNGTRTGFVFEEVSDLFHFVFPSKFF
jgi:hypothetical protein